MKNKIWNVIFFILLLLSCKNETKFEVIDFQDAFTRKKDVCIDNYLKGISCIPLQTDSNCIIGDIEKLIKSGNYFFILDSENILYMFLNDGKFIRKIGKKGNGPNEYSYISDFCIDDVNKRIYVDINKAIAIFDFNGTFIKKIDNHGADQILFYNNKIVLSMPDRPVETQEKDAILITESSGRIVKFFKTPLVRYGGFEFTFSLLFKADDYCYYKEELGDTLYEIDKSFNRKPASVFQLGKYKMPKEDFDFSHMTKWDKYYRFVDVYKLSSLTIYKVQNGPVGGIDYIFRDNENNETCKITNEEKLALFLNQEKSIPILPVSVYDNHLVCCVYPTYVNALANYLKTDISLQNPNFKENNNPILLDIKF